MGSHRSCAQAAGGQCWRVHPLCCWVQVRLCINSARHAYNIIITRCHVLPSQNPHCHCLLHCKLAWAAAGPWLPLCFMHVKTKAWACCLHASCIAKVLAAIRQSRLLQEWVSLESCMHLDGGL